VSSIEEQIVVGVSTRHFISQDDTQFAKHMVFDQAEASSYLPQSISTKTHGSSQAHCRSPRSPPPGRLSPMSAREHDSVASPIDEKRDIEKGAVHGNRTLTFSVRV
jgi:hypothetical protein